MYSGNNEANKISTTTSVSENEWMSLELKHKCNNIQPSNTGRQDPDSVNYTFIEQVKYNSTEYFVLFEKVVNKCTSNNFIMYLIKVPLGCDYFKIVSFK